MDIKEALLYEHSKTQRDKILKYIGDDAEKFDVLMVLFFGGEHNVSQRAAWVMSYCAEKYPVIIKPYLVKLVQHLDTNKIHDSIKRNTFRLLQYINVPKKAQGQLLHKCYEYILSKDEPPAIKAFAITVAFNICQQEPDLLNELKVIVDDLLEHSNSPAILSRCKQVKRFLKKHK